MQYASKISSLNPHKLIEEVSKAIKKHIEQGNDPEKTILVISLNTIKESELLLN